MNTRTALRATASLALLTLAALPALPAATAQTSADEIVQPEWQGRFDLARLVGGWQTPFGQIEFEMLDGSTGIGRIFFNGQWSTLSSAWLPERGLMVQVTDPANPQKPIHFALRMSADGKRFEARHYNDTSIGGRTIWAATATDMVTLDRSMWVGKWKTPQGELSLTAEGYHLTGTLVTPAGAGRVAATRQVTLVPTGRFNEPNTGQLSGAWRGINGTSGAGSLRLEMGRNAESFFARITRDVMGAMREETFEGQRVRKSAPPPAAANSPSG